VVNEHVRIAVAVFRAGDLNQAVLPQNLLRQGRDPHVGLGHVAEEVELTAPLVEVDPLLTHPGGLRQEGLLIAVNQLRKPRQLLRGNPGSASQRGLPADQQPVGKAPDGLYPQVLLMKQLPVGFLQELRVPDDSQLKAVVQDVVNGLLGIGLGEIDLNLLPVLNAFEKFGKGIGDVGGTGDGDFHGGQPLVPALQLPLQNLQLVDDLPRQLQEGLAFPPSVPAVPAGVRRNTA